MLRRCDVFPTPPPKQADYYFFFRTDVIDYANDHKLILTERALLALIQDHSPRDGDGDELVKSIDRLKELYPLIDEAEKKAIAANKAAGKEYKFDQLTGFGLGRLYAERKELNRKIESLNHRISHGVWYDTPNSRKRFCDSVGIKERQFYRIKKHLLDIGAIQHNQYNNSYRADIPRTEKGSFFRVLSDFRIFGYFDSDEFNVPMDFLDKCYLSYIHQRMNPKHPNPNAHYAGESRFDHKYNFNRQCSEEPLNGETPFSLAFREHFTELQISDKTFCRVLGCCPSTLNKLRKKWQFLIKTKRHYQRPTTYHFLFDQKVFFDSFLQDREYLDPFFDAQVDPNPHLNNHLNELFNAPSAERQAEQDAVISPEIVSEFRHLRDELQEHLSTDKPYEQFPKQTRFEDLELLLQPAFKQFDVLYMKVDLYAEYLKRHPERDPVKIAAEKAAQAAQKAALEWEAELEEIHLTALAAAKEAEDRMRRLGLLTD